MVGKVRTSFVAFMVMFCLYSTFNARSQSPPKAEQHSAQHECRLARQHRGGHGLCGLHDIV